MQTHMEQEVEVLLEESSVASRPWANRKVLGVLGVLGLAGTAAVAAMPHKFSSKATLAPEGIIQAQYQPPGPYGAQQGYGAQVAHGPVGAPIAEHPANFIPFAEAQAMAAGAAAPAAPLGPGGLPPPRPTAYPAGLPGPYGAQQGYGAGVGHGPNGAPIAVHPEDFVAHADAPAQNGDKPVHIDIFYETKCPFSQQFIDGEVKPALSDPTCVFQHVHINWEPYGNVQDTGGAFICQHGGDECFGNKLHLCAKKEFGGNDDGLNKWITCHMEFLSASPANSARDIGGYQQCPGADAQKLTQCANDPAIFEDFRRVGQETQAAHSQHMPWAITAIGGPNLQGQLVQGLCQMYGTGALAAYPKPACC